ncbi:TPA: glycosyltransferase family 1 protein [Candidatus Micrarchaeota archaeon]|nr:glycosyltransferase family 1 protein [Candidatus Micrarchaeota archaeon]
MKIAVFTDSFRPQKNGVAVFLSESLKALSEKHDVVLFAPGEGKLREEKTDGYRIYWVPAAPFPFYEGYRMSSTTPLEINRLLKEEEPDIVHLHAPILLGIHGLIAAKKRGIPIIATYHTHFPDYLPHLLRGKLFKLVGGIGDYTTKKLIKLVFSQVDLSTAPTKELVRELTDYGIENVVHLPNGVNIKKMHSVKGDGKKLRKQYGIPDKKIILYAGRVSFEKKLEVLLEAFRELDGGDAVLLVVGSGPSLDKYREMAEEMGLKDVIFTGFVEDDMLSAAYSAADVFASPSDSETFGLTFVEAMSFGLPVVGVNRLGAKELIDGKNGQAVEPGDSKAFAEKLKELLADAKLRKRMRKAALETSAQYTMEKCIGKTVELYEKLLSRRKK